PHDEVPVDLGEGEAEPTRTAGAPPEQPYPPDDPPTRIGPDGTMTWLNSDGKLHRVNGPAIIGGDGSQQWLQDGRPHRIGGPANISANGVESWSRKGELHRTDGPAIIGQDGAERWYLYGQPLRLDGPAVVTLDGAGDEWW